MNETIQLRSTDTAAAATTVTLSFCFHFTRGTLGHAGSLKGLWQPLRLPQQGFSQAGWLSGQPINSVRAQRDESSKEHVLQNGKISKTTRTMHSMEIQIGAATLCHWRG